MLTIHHMPHGMFESVPQVCPKIDFIFHSYIRGDTGLERLAAVAALKLHLFK